MTPETLPLIRRIPAGPKAPLRIPKSFHRLYDLTYNLWWSWDKVAYELMSRIDARRWAMSGNPLSMLQVVEPETWEALEASGTFVELYTEAVQRFDDYIDQRDTWFTSNHSAAFDDGPIAYLCTEYGLHHSLPLYSGGLGVLAGDHLKAASDLGLPLVAVGLFYRRGYFRQAVDPDGNQQHIYNAIEPARRPMTEVLDPTTGRPVRISIDLPGRTVHAGAWKIDAGRVPLLLLDTDISENEPADRPITHVLYVRGREMRLHQEIVLGIGGVRLLESLGITPSVWHVNEGHAALSLVERLSTKLQTGKGIETARREIIDSTLFTLHTPVPAGNEVFDLDLVVRSLGDAVPHMTPEILEEVSKARPEDHNRFDLGAMAIRLSARTNGVSKRHGEIVTHEWGHLLGGEAAAVTNGIHPQTWVGRTMGRLFTKAIGPDWADRLLEPEAWKAIYDLPDDDIWQAHLAQKEFLLGRIRARMQEQYSRHGDGPSVLRWIDDQLPTDRLTIVFARRFATYKRAGLLFSDPGRARELLTDPERPVQIVFAGKAHPADREGQGLMRWVVEMSHSPDLRSNVFFLEGYDMYLARALVGGADVWLNTPRPPMEASGTSGMKSAANGGLNLSVLDGWWMEGYNGKNGWGFGEHHNSDAEDAGTLFHLMQSEVVPAYYERNDDGIPERWVAMMKEAIVTCAPAFSMQRTVADYATEGYVPLATRSAGARKTASGKKTKS